MAIRLYFPTCGKFQKGVLWQVLEADADKSERICIGSEEFAEDRKMDGADTDFWSALQSVAKVVPVQLSPRGSDGRDLKISGKSATGCFDFFMNYDCSEVDVSLDIAVSIRSDYSGKAGIVSDVAEKLKLCVENKINAFILSREHERDIPGDITVRHLNQVQSIDELKHGGGTVVLLADENWEKSLARLLGAKVRVPRESDRPSSSRIPGEHRLWELYLAALSADEDRKQGDMLRELFQDGGIADSVMKEDTFPYRALFGQDDAGTPCRNVVFPRSKSERKPPLLLVGSTSTGKTTLAKALLLNALSLNIRAVYISPTRALVYEVYNDFTALLRKLRTQAKNFDCSDSLEVVLRSVGEDQILCSTGERGEHDGQILRGDYKMLFSVYEKANLFMNLILDQPKDKQPQLIVIDELHMLVDEQRGGILDLFMAKILDSSEGARIVGITTEGSGAETVRRFLNSMNDRSMRSRMPATSVLTIGTRPCTVEHYAVLGHEIWQKISTFSSSHTPELSDSEARDIARDFERKRPDAEQNPFEYTDILNAISPHGTPHEKILVVFNSIERIYDLIEKMTASRTQTVADWTDADSSSVSGTNFCDGETLRRIHGALQVSLVSTEERNKLWKGAQAGIFVYYSPMDYKLREAMAEGFRTGRGCQAQLLMTTEALAYGVNLPADAVYLTYVRDIDGELLKRNVFFNLLGRVGRLGTSRVEHQCAYIVPMADSTTGIVDELISVLPFYGRDDGGFDSPTFDITDMEKLLPGTNEMHHLDDMKFPTFRSALDALRFTVLKTSRDRGSLTFVHPYQVRAHLNHSLFGWEMMVRDGGQLSTGEMDEILQSLFEVIHDAPGFEVNRLVDIDTSLIRSDNRSDPAFFCTDLASALIDTGTSWKAILPMNNWLKCISAMKNYRALPVELLLVGMLPVQELWESIRKFDQQSRKFTVSISEESAEWARRALVQELRRLDEALPVDDMVRTIEEYLRNDCQNLELVSRRRGDPLSVEARRGSFFRLLAALLAWTRGASPDDIQKLASPVEGNTDFSLSFSPRYGDRASWLCILCLRFFSRTERLKLCPEHEGALQNLAMRVRYGVPKDCIPLMGVGNERLSRTQVLDLVHDGLTLKAVMQSTYEEYGRRGATSFAPRRRETSFVSSDEFERLVKNAEAYYRRAALDFGSILVKRSSRACQEAWGRLKGVLDDSGARGGASVAESLMSMVPGGSFECQIIGADGRELLIRQADSRNELILSILDATDRDNYDGLTDYICSLSDQDVRLCVWVPWKKSNRLPDPCQPTIGLMSAVLLLSRMSGSSGIRVDNVYSWVLRQKRAGRHFFRIQQLIGSADDGIDELRDFLPGEVLQGVLQMEEVDFSSEN